MVADHQGAWDQTGVNPCLGYPFAFQVRPNAASRLIEGVGPQ
jgi:hypothetical protein